MTEENEDYRYGLTGLSTQFYDGFHCEGTTLDVAVRAAASDAEEIRADALLLLESTLPDWAVDAVWRGASELVRMSGVRQWLREVVALCDAAIRDAEPGFFALYAAPTVTEDLTGAVLDELLLIGPSLTRKAGHHHDPRHMNNGVPGLVPALDLAIRAVGAQLGFRLMMRSVSNFWLPLDKATYDRYAGLWKRLGYGNLADWDVHHLIEEDE